MEWPHPKREPNRGSARPGTCERGRPRAGRIAKQRRSPTVAALAIHLEAPGPQSTAPLRDEALAAHLSHVKPQWKTAILPVLLSVRSTRAAP